MEDQTHHRRLSDQDILDQEFTDRDARLMVWHGVNRVARHVMRMANVAAGVSIALERLWVRQFLDDVGPYLGAMPVSPGLVAAAALIGMNNKEVPRGYTLL